MKISTKLLKQTFTINQAISLNEWVHICMTWSVSAGGALYVNGDLVAENKDMTPSSFPLGGYVTLAQVRTPFMKIVGRNLSKYRIGLFKR